MKTLATIDPSWGEDAPLRPGRPRHEIEKPIVTHDTDSNLTRKGAMIEARKIWGELATIMSDDDLPRRVWMIGHYYQTVGIGRTWEQAIAASKRKAAKFNVKQLLADERLA